MIHRLKNSISIVLKGYSRLILTVSKIILILAAAAGINVLLIYPLWYTAIHFKTAYSVVTSIIIASLLLFLIGKSAVKKFTLEKSRGKSPLSAFLRPVIKICASLIIISFLYLFILLFFKGYRIYALIGFVFFLFGTGSLFFIKKS